MRKRRILALLLALVMLLGVTGVTALADTWSEITVSLRIEGLDKCLYYSDDLVFAASDEANTVADLFASLKDGDGFPKVTIKDGEYGAYIADIEGLAEMSHGDMSCWNFRVNGKFPPVGIGKYEVMDGDEIVIFFGDLFDIGMQYPVVDMSRLLTDGVIKVTSEDTKYDEDWNATVKINPVAGATVALDKTSFITDENGEAAVELPAELAGIHTLQIGKYDEETNLPLVLRFAPEYTVFVPFADMADGAWYADAVEYCVGNGLFAGMGGNNFAPDASMTMAQLATVLCRIAGEDTTSAEGLPWYTAALDWAADVEIMLDITYQPNDSVTREVFIHMFYNTAALDEENDMEQNADITGAADYERVSDEYTDAISWAVAAGIITGTDNGALTISPEAEVSRAVVCQMLMRYYG